VKLAQPEMVMKAVWKHTLRLLEKQKASMKFICAEEALSGWESRYQRNDIHFGSTYKQYKRWSKCPRDRWYRL